MFAKTFAIAGLATALLFGAVPAHAAITENALTQNALTQNALTGNAITGNAIAGNAMDSNSIRPVAVADRQNLGTASGLRIIAVELPASR